MIGAVTPAKHPLDVCYCGDYRKDHALGKGPCRFNKSHRHDLTHGYENCTEFVLATAYEQSAKEQEGKTR